MALTQFRCFSAAPLLDVSTALLQPLKSRAIWVLFALTTACSGGGGGEEAVAVSSPSPATVTPSSPAMVTPSLPDTPAPSPPATTTTPPSPDAPTPPTTLPPPNRAPIIANPNPNPLGVGGHTFSFDFTQGGMTFADPDGDALSYAVATHYRNTSLPGPLTVDGTTIRGVLPADGWIKVIIFAQDSHGASTPHEFTIRIAPNSPPIAAIPNLAVMTTAGVHFNYDPTQQGTTFTDVDGDPLRYEMRTLSDAKGLSIAGVNVVGALNAVGAVWFEITAFDDYGGSGKDRFAIALAAPEPGAPTLPATRFVYADAELPLPWRFRDSSETFLGPFWNVTPADNLITNAGATLGRVLFYDKRLSITNTHSCASCHEQARGFAGSERFATGVQGLPMRRNAMGLANLRFAFPERWFSDLRAQSIESLTLMPIEEPTELGNFLPAVERKLGATSFYPPLFAAAFGTPNVTADRISKALAQFLRSMMSYRTKYDRAYRHGMEHVPGVLTPEEVRGEEFFQPKPEAACGMCHFQEVQAMFFAANNGLDLVVTDPGAGEGVFRAASLRNIAVTAPYMHDGRFATLREVIDHYDHGIQPSPALSDRLKDPLGMPKRLDLTEADKRALEAFLHALTDHEFLTDPKFADPF